MAFALAAPAGAHDLVIHATSLGMKTGDALPIGRETIARTGLVAECVIAPEMTPLLEAARELGRPIHGRADARRAGGADARVHERARRRARRGGVVSRTLYVAAAIAIGASISVQPPINAVMARSLGSPMVAACISIAISLIAVLALSLAFGGSADLSQVRGLPWWIVLGGLVGVLFVAGGVVVAPALGVALFFVCVIAGQLLGSMVADHVGAFGMAVQPVSLTKLLGLALVLAGAALFQVGR